MIDPLVQNVASLVFGLSSQLQAQTLTAAVALNLIGPQFTAQIPDIVAKLQAHHVTDLLSQPYLVGSTTLGQLLEVAGVAGTGQQAFAQALATNTKSMRNFWRTLGDGTSGLTAAEASTIERTLSIGAFVKNYTPLVQNVLQGFSSGTYKTMADVARLTLQDWTNLVNQAGAPPGIDAAGQATPAEVFASVVYTRITRSYPTAALSSRITSGKFVPEALQRPLTTFFANNPSLELLTHNILAYLAAQPNALAGIAAESQAEVVASLRGFQRVLRVAPRPDVAETLLNLGFTSATQINAMGSQGFFDRATAGGLTKPEANAAFAAASQRYAQVVSLYMQLNRGSLGLLPQGIGDLAGFAGAAQQAVQQDPTLTTLFGSQDYCATDDCTSVLSPAAYLCDLLLWLRGHQQGPQTALDLLDNRRPDIRHLLLNCPNSDTELPYVDLVIELLADAISPPIDSAATSYVQSALVDATTYYYVVTAVNALGEAQRRRRSPPPPRRPRQCRRRRPAPLRPPATPRSRSHGARCRGDQLQRLLVHHAGRHHVQRHQGPRGGPVLPPVGAGRRHDVLLRRHGRQRPGRGPASAQVSATPEKPTAVPPAPAGVAATAGDTQVTLTWGPVAGATSYNVYWSTTPGVTTSNGTKVPVARPSYLQSALVDATTYYYVVTAVNALGEGPASAQVSATPEAPTAVPPAPAGVAATAGDTRVTLTWAPLPGRPATTSTGPRPRASPLQTARRSPAPGTPGGSRLRPRRPRRN